MIDTNIRYPEYFSALLEKASKAGMHINQYKLKYNKRSTPEQDQKEPQKKRIIYKGLKLSTFDQKKNNLLITAGFHGNEIAGPLTILHKLEEMLELGKQYNVGLVIFPNINPSGFDLRQRYNILCDPESDDAMPNNDFMRYVVDHRIVEDLGERTKFDAWVYSWDKNIVGRLPHETLVMHKEIKDLPIRRFKGHLDFHQDCFTDELFENNKPTETDKRATYAYVFDRTTYIPIMNEAGKIVPIAKNFFIDSGYKQKPKIIPSGLKDLEVLADEKVRVCADENGLIIRRDGSITDLTSRLKVPYAAAVETTDATPIEQSMQVYMTWVKGFMELMQKKK